MSIILRTIYDYIVNKRKKDTLIISFNPICHNLYSGNDDKNISFVHLLEDSTNTKKQQEFVEFMKYNYPKVHIERIFDYSSKFGNISLGSYAIDCECTTSDKVYNALHKKYMDKENNTDCILQEMSYEDAKNIYDEREKYKKKTLTLEEELEFFGTEF